MKIVKWVGVYGVVGGEISTGRHLREVETSARKEGPEANQLRL